MKHQVQISRRRFLQVLATATGALVVGVPLARAADAPLPLGLLGDDFHGLGSYVRIDSAGLVLIGARDPDTGTGVATSLPRIVADEMDADWARVQVVQLGLGVADGSDGPRWLYGHQAGGLGTAIPSAWHDLRYAGALVRWLLVQAAAQRWNLPASTLRTVRGEVIAPDGRKLGYGTLVADASNITPPTYASAPKLPSAYTLIGQGAGDVDARAMVTGQSSFAIDGYPADALVAVLVHCPWPDGRIARIDTSRTLAVKGVVRVLQLEPERGQPLGQTLIAPAIAVLADSTWAALQGRTALQVEWKPGAGADENSDALEQHAIALVSDSDDPTTRVRDDGDLRAAARKVARRVSATYVQPWLAHAVPEPMNCLVQLGEDHATLTVPTQLPQHAFAVVQRLTGLRPSQISIAVPRIGGGYGRRVDHDYVVEAVMLAKLTGKPIKLMWTRGDEFGHDYYRSGCVHTIEALLDRKRQLIGWNQRMASASANVGRGVPADQLYTSEVRPDQLPVGLVPAYRSDWYALDSSIPRGLSRGEPHVVNAFAVQSFVDEIAHALKEDPLDTHRRLIGAPRQIPLGDGRTLDTARLGQVLELVAGRIGWKDWLHSVNGLGLACWHLDGAYVAHAVEAAIQGQTLVIKRVVCAIDVGRVVNPTGLEGQVAGATLDALSNALNLAITYQGGQVQQRDFKDYPLASVAQLPDTVEVIQVADDGRDPTGASFMAMPTAAPALANAVFRASAVRVRRLPLMKELLRLL